ncbi:hypothetical protein HGA13_24510 [Nocardia speluncae]|uniref:Uncharacterized protein n=1 Tax=Nocardia speluncae TaxID=419477 RepID=A0A846XNF2_9NOCA|nr:hypothetical protein [Nocardia speluncae]
MERVRPVPSRRPGRATAPRRADDLRAGAAPRRRGRSVVIGLAAAGLLLATGCDSVSGIPVDDPATGAADTDMSIPPAATATAVAPAPALPPVPADAPPVGEVPGVPEAAPALQRFAADVRAGGLATLQEACWTIPPRTTQTMYADPDAVLDALAQPGTATDGTITWTDGVTSVTAERDQVASGYACGRVFPAGVEPAHDDADARHTVRRYLARLVGQPLHPDDQEAEYPLVCAANPATWDPQGSGAPEPAPLANNPGILTGTTGFTDQLIGSQQLTPGYMSVTAPVTNASGVTQDRTFVLADGDNGYCIGEISD